MKILSINIRATQGGAGRMALDLHRRLSLRGDDVQLLYGYGSGIKADPYVENDSTVNIIGSRSVVIANFASHLLLGREILTSSRAKLQTALDWADVVHVHAAHHWYLNWHDFINMLSAAGTPTVLTAHDWWLISGRCGFVRDCTGWQRSCGECGDMRFQDLPSLFDRSRSVRSNRQRALRSIAGQLIIACPSQHLQRDHAAIYPDLKTHYIPNALDLEFENHLDAQPLDSERSGYLFCASDLASPGKIDRALVSRMIDRFGSKVNLVGRNNPFSSMDVTVHGEVRERRDLIRIFSQTKALMFTSKMDNAPLTIIEALTLGCYVIAYPSPAAEEMIRLVGGRCASSPDEAFAIVAEGRESEVYGGLSHIEVARRAREVWSGNAMTESYREIYAQLATEFGKRRA